MRLPVARARPFVDLSEFDLGGTFRVRCSWESDFELDEFSVVVTAVDVEHRIRHTPIRRLVHSSSHPTAPLAKRADGAYAELVTGEFIDLEFPAEPLQPGMERSFILAAKGYYLTWFGHENASRPLEFGLNGNYPNPFNPSTTIRYSLASDAVVTLEVFNVLGQKVRTLVQGQSQLPGSYEILWDGKDAKGREVGSGAYLYRLKAGDFVETRKAIMLK
jgi:hypothetical protein